MKNTIKVKVSDGFINIDEEKLLEFPLCQNIIQDLGYLDNFEIPFPGAQVQTSLSGIYISSDIPVLDYLLADVDINYIIVDDKLWTISIKDVIELYPRLIGRHYVDLCSDDSKNQDLLEFMFGNKLFSDVFQEDLTRANIDIFQKNDVPKEKYLFEVINNDKAYKREGECFDNLSNDSIQFLLDNIKNINIIHITYLYTVTGNILCLSNPCIMPDLGVLSMEETFMRGCCFNKMKRQKRTIYNNYCKLMDSKQKTEI